MRFRGILNLLHNSPLFLRKVKWNGSNTVKVEVCTVRIVFSGRNKERWNRFQSSGVRCRLDYVCVRKASQLPCDLTAWVAAEFETQTVVLTKQIHLTQFCRISDECLVFGWSNKEGCKGGQACGSYEGEQKYIQVWLVKLEGKRLLWRRRCRWEDNIKMYLNEINK
jgi:hypothetical protein